MAKYNRLKKEELEKFKEEFIAFLIAQGVDADMWQELEMNNPEKYNDIIDQFSDYIISQSLANCQYISSLRNQVLSAYHCQSSGFQHFIAHMTENQLKKINNEMDLEDCIKNEHQHIDLQYIQSQYPINREDFLYSLIEEGGYQIDNGKWYKLLAMVWATK